MTARFLFHSPSERATQSTSLDLWDLDPTTLDVPNDIESQMRIAYRSLGDVLGQFGCTLRDVVSQTVYFVGDHEAAVAAGNAVRPDVFGDELPTSAMIGVARLVDPRFLVEIQSIAYRG